MKAAAHVAAIENRSRATITRGLLRFVFVARAVISFSVALMLTGAPATLVGLGVSFIAFTFADGTLAIVMASLAYHRRLLRGKFVVAALLDGVVLLGAGMTLLIGHRIPDYGLLSALYIAIAASCFSVVGVVQLLVARRFYRRLGGHVLSVGLVIAGLASAAVGIEMLVMPPNVALAKQLLVVALVLQGLAILVPAVSAWPASVTLEGGNAR
ncbi:MAG: hypothetical protein ACRENU_09330 [Gemmatimonadaceae bacterium]